jgi:uncharacterized protein with PQ loop repeat
MLTEHKDSLLGAAIECLGGMVFLIYGLTRRPLEFNHFNPRRKPLPVWAARLVYLPFGILFLFFSIRDLYHALK